MQKSVNLQNRICWKDVKYIQYNILYEYHPYLIH